MADIKDIKEKLLKSNSLATTFLRSIVSSQCASWTDYAVCFLLFATSLLDPFWATAAGALCGGVVNCIINYKFTFHADGCDWRAVVVKYAFVWVGSLLLNSFGTEFMYMVVKKWSWLDSFNISHDLLFVGARLFVSLMVSWFWNFGMQRYVVYRPMSFDKYLSRLLGGSIKHKEKNTTSSNNIITH